MPFPAEFKPYLGMPAKNGTKSPELPATGARDLGRRAVNYGPGRRHKPTYMSKNAKIQTGRRLEKRGTPSGAQGLSGNSVAEVDLETAQAMPSRASGAREIAVLAVQVLPDSSAPPIARPTFKGPALFDPISWSSVTLHPDPAASHWRPLAEPQMWLCWHRWVRPHQAGSASRRSSTPSPSTAIPFPGQLQRTKSTRHGSTEACIPLALAARPAWQRPSCRCRLRLLAGPSHPRARS